MIGELAGIFGLALGAPMGYYVSSGQLDRVAAWLFCIADRAGKPIAGCRKLNWLFTAIWFEQRAIDDCPADLFA